MKLLLRPFDPDRDYPAFAAAERAIYGDDAEPEDCALKVRGIAYARAHGHTHLRTSNDSTNAPMLAINDRLGFVRRPGQFEMVKDLLP